MKAICLKCGKYNGPNIPIGADYAGHICPKCYKKLQEKFCSPDWFIDGRWKPKPTPDPKVEQVAKRPDLNDYESMYANAVGELLAEQKELRVYKRALEMRCDGWHSAEYNKRTLDAYVAAARKETENGK